MAFPGNQGAVREIWAEGAKSETFVDDDNRVLFHNAYEYAVLYPDAVREPVRYRAPRLAHGYVLESIRERLAVRAGVREPRSTIPPRGFLDDRDRDRIEGWARSPEFPEEPVCLDILVDGVVRAEPTSPSRAGEAADTLSQHAWHRFR